MLPALLQHLQKHMHMKQLTRLVSLIQQKDQLKLNQRISIWENSLIYGLATSASPLPSYFLYTDQLACWQAVGPQ